MHNVRMFADGFPHSPLTATEQWKPSGAWDRLRPGVDKLFGDIVDDLQQLAELYEPARVRQWDDTSVPRDLSRRAPAQVERLLEHGPDVGLHDYLLAGSCVYVISPAGRGKSTYIHYNLKVALPRRLFPVSLIPIIFDVRQCPSAEEFLPLFVRQIDREIDHAFSFFSMDSDEKAETTVHQALCDAFAKELRKAGISSAYAPKGQDPHLHELQRAYFSRLRSEDLVDFNATRLNYARKRTPNVVVVLAVDNMDQHLPFPGGERIIVQSHSIASRLQCPLILTLRETSFRRHNPAFASSSYTARYLALSGARAQPLVARRLAKLASLIQDDPSLARFVAAIASRLVADMGPATSRTSKLVADWIDPISNGDRRVMLDVVSSIVSSPHIGSRTFERNRSPINDYLNVDFEVALAKLKMAVLLGPNAYYVEESPRAYALNLFREDRADIASRNLIRLKILQHLYKRREEGTTVRDVVRKCTSVIGDSAAPRVKRAIASLLERDLAVVVSESEAFSAALQRLPLDLNTLMANILYVTSSGVFHHDILLQDDIYLDEMKYSTPLPTEVYNEVFLNYRGEAPVRRYVRQKSTLRFLRYLRLCEEDETTQRLSAALDVPDIVQASYQAYNETARRMDLHTVTRPREPGEG